MDPFTLSLGAISAVGFGMQLFGGVKQSQDAKQVANVSADVAAKEEAENAQRRQQMELQASRQQVENVRNLQRARAQGTAAAVQGGAQYGSGLAGGQAAATDEAGFNALGINQNLGIGRTLFGLSDQISQDKIQLAQLKGKEATDQGIGNIGGDILKSAGPFNNLFKSMFGGTGGAAATSDSTATAGGAFGITGSLY